MRAKKLLSVLLAGAMMMGVLAGCGGGSTEPTFTPDVTWTDTTTGDESVESYAVKFPTLVTEEGVIKIESLVPAEDGTVAVEPNGTVNFTVTANKDYLIKAIKVDATEVTGEEVNFPTAGPVNVTLTNVNSEPEITVEYVKANLTVTVTNDSVKVTVNGSEVTGSVPYGTTVTITPNRPNSYTVKNVTANDKNVEAQDDVYTYTVTDDVVLGATFEASPIQSVQVIGEPDDKDYGVGEIFNVSGLKAVITYENGDTTEPRDLDTANATVSGTLAKGDTQVTITYTDSEQRSKDTTYILSEGNVKVNYLSDASKKIIINDFNVAATTTSHVSLLVDPAVIANLGQGSYLLGVYYFDVNNVKYAAVEYSVNIKDGYTDEVQNAVSNFYSDQVAEAITYQKFENWHFVTKEREVRVYLDINEDAGSCTMWVVYNR